MFKRLMAAALTTGLLFGAPSVALAQSAGDNQYQDPLPSSGSGNGSSGSGSSGHSGSSGGGSTAAPRAATPAPQPTGTTRASAAPANELPRTGGEPLLVAVVGSALLLAGGGLTLAAPRRD
jgi:hypothetical protein